MQYDLTVIKLQKSELVLMTKCKLPRVAVASCAVALLFLIASRVGAEEQPPDLYAQPSQDVVRKLLNVARKACRGTLDNNEGLLKALKMNGPTYFYLPERSSPEVAFISSKNCPEPSPNAEFIVARLVKGRSPFYYYKTSARTARPIEAAVSYHDPRPNAVVYEPIAVTKELQDDYQRLINFLMAKW